MKDSHIKDKERNVDIISRLVYDEEKSAPEGDENEVTMKELVDSALVATNNTQASGAAMLGMTANQLSYRIRTGHMRVDEMLELFKAIGVEIKLVKKNSDEEIPIPIKYEGYGPRVRAMVDRVTYDTGMSSALANNFYADGENEYTDGKAMELYVDREGRYFFAEYSIIGNQKPRITPVSGEEAAAFIEKYGTEIDKRPNKEDENVPD